MSILKKIWLSLLVASVSGGAIFYFLYYSENGSIPSITNDYPLLITSFLVANIIAFTLYKVNKILNRLASWQKSVATRLILSLAINITLSLCILWAVGFLWLTLISPNEISNPWTYNTDLSSKLMVITIISLLIYTVFNFAIFSYNQYTYAHIESEKNRRKNLELQFGLLKSQLSPHYLFNCLNTISSLVYKDAHLAEDFIRRLAETYHYILKNNKKKYVSLKEEVEFVKSYNYLLQVRFESNISLDINLPPNIMDSRIPPITLQMLVENAVKHNIISKDYPLSIYISALDNTNIRVTNTKTKSPQRVSSFNVGLTNIQSRYQYLTQQKVRIDDGEKYTVTLPVVKNKMALSA